MISLGSFHKGSLRAWWNPERKILSKPALGGRKDFLRRTMLNETEPETLIHAAVAWYAMREPWETPTEEELHKYNVVLSAMMTDWNSKDFAMEFPCDGGDDVPWQSFADKKELLQFLLTWKNKQIEAFLAAGMVLEDELACSKPFETVWRRVVLTDLVYNAMLGDKLQEQAPLLAEYSMEQADREGD